MGTNNVVSLLEHRAARLAAEVASPVVVLDPVDGETVDEFIERVGIKIAELIGAARDDGAR